MSFESRSIGSEEYCWSPSNSSSTSSPAIYLSYDDDFLTVMGKLCELFDRPSTHELPKGIRLSTVKTYLPQISYFNLSHLTRAPTMGDADSSFDICFYYTRENPDEDALGTPSNGSSGTPDTTVFGDVFKAFDESYTTPPRDPEIDRQLELLQREAPLRKLMKLTRIEVIDSPTFEKITTDNFTCRSELGTQFSDANIFRIPSESRELFKTPVRSRPRPFYGVSNSPFCLYTSFSFPDTPETIFKGNDHDCDVFDDDYDFTGLHDIEFEKSHHPRLNRVKKFVRKVLTSKANSDLSFSSSDEYSEVGLSMNSWAESTGTLSGWTTISLSPSPFQSPMLRNEMWR